MSQLQAILVEAGVMDCAYAARCMYDQQPFPSKHMPYAEYEQRILDDCLGAPTWLVVDEDGREVAWLVTDYDYDMQYPGKGAMVYHLAVDKNYPAALRILMKAFLRHAKHYGCQWYQTTTRVDEHTIVAKFKRIR